MPRGGARNGRPGQSYPNRADLNVAKLPAVAAPGQQYGQAGQQMQAQQAMPMGAQPTAGGGAGADATAAPAVTPGSLGALNRPTERPDEPLTAGAPVGPGPSTQNLPPLPSPQQSQFTNARDLLTGLASAQPDNAALAYLAAAADRGL